MRNYGEDLDINRQKREGMGFKAERIHRSNLLDSSTAIPGGTVTVMLPKIKNEPIVPGTMYLSFKAKPKSSSDQSASFVQNLGRAIIVEKHLKFNGKPATTIREYGDYKLYTDLWLTKGERKNRILQGIQDITGLKHRLGSKKATTSGGSTTYAALTNATDEHKAITTAYGNTFYIPFDDELFHDIAPFCPYFLNDTITVEIKLAEAKDIVLSTDTSATYEISDLHLEWDGIQDESLAREISNTYTSGLGVYYDRIQFLRKENYAKNTTLINTCIKESVRSLRGVLILFKDSSDQVKYACNRETFYNPGIERINISINGAANKLYANGIIPKDLWYEARKFFQGSTNMSQGAFYNDKFCLWVDLRSSSDMKLHGNGLKLDTSNSGVQLAINKKDDGSGTFSMYIYLVIDAFMEFQDNSYKRICYALTDNCEYGDGDQ